MKKIIFILLVFCISIIGIYGTLQLQKAQEIAKTKNDLEGFLNYETGVYSYSDTKKDFLSKNSKSNFNYYLLSSVDGIYFQSQDKNSIKIQKIGDTTNINIGEGVYIFVLNDIFEKYKINGEDFAVSQLGKGIFYISNIENDYKIYSFNSILDVSLIKRKKEITSFELFPSLLFKYKPEYNDAIVGGDIIRVSTINSIIFSNSKNSYFFKNLEVKDSNYDVGGFITKSLSDISDRYKENQNIYKEVLSLNVEEISGLDYINKYSSLLDNNTKKDVYFKNQILIYFLNILKSGDNNVSLQENKQNLANAMDEIKNYSDVAYNDGIDLLKNYYYLSYYSNGLNNSSTSLGVISKNSINKTLKDIFKDEIAGKEYFSELSEAFFAYNFTGFTKTQLDEYINNYLVELKNNNVLKEKDYLNFSFFLTKYSSDNSKISKNSLGIVIQLIDIFNSYYSTLKNITLEDKKTKSTALSIQFLNLTNIVNNVIINISKTYFENKDGNNVLQEKYTKIIGDQIDANIGDNITDTIGVLYRNGISDLASKKDSFYIEKGESNLSVEDGYSQLQKKYTQLGNIYSKILVNYNTYVSKFKLDKTERDIQSEKLVNTYILTTDDAKEYLQKFNGIDFGTLKILNIPTMNSDKYYLIEVYIYQRKFKFKLFPEPKYNHSISSVEYEDQEGKIIKDNDNVIPLDQKEKYFQDKLSSEEDPIKREKYDFKNFFYNTYLVIVDNTNDNVYDNGQTTQPEKNESSTISIFKQNQLLDGDFTYVNSFIKIPFNSINVTIENGKYVILINKVNKTFSAESSSFNSELSMSYIFNEHSFQNVSIKLLQDDPTNGYEIDGKSISIAPEKISHKEFTKKLKNLGYYLNAIRQNYKPTDNNLKIDLNLSKVFIDSRGINVEITN
ncbi:MAG: hypothetical protein PHZ26_03545 [Candidatus Gracilibacteria bacterium]|nr:hypothetical protein [Candidatus Gracilibacteria bacterium]MDD2908801.1 hypothetical protein [Candidatus Gracilibacteria bacterium]